MEPTLLAAPNHDTILNLGCVYGVCILNILEAKIIIKKISSNEGLVGWTRFYRMHRKFGYCWAERRDPIDLMDRPH